MTLHDLGAERPRDPSETRRWGERERTDSDAYEMSNRKFMIAFALVVLALAVFALLVYNL